LHSFGCQSLERRKKFDDGQLPEYLPDSELQISGIAIFHSPNSFDNDPRKGRYGESFRVDCRRFLFISRQLQGEAKLPSREIAEFLFDQFFISGKQFATVNCSGTNWGIRWVTLATLPRDLRRFPSNKLLTSSTVRCVTPSAASRCSGWED